MKYFTKEWYQLMQKTGFDVLLRASDKAQIFSEEYFKYLYKKKEREWLKLQKEVSEVSFDDIYPEQCDIDTDGLDLSVVALEKILKAYNEERTNALNNWVPFIYDETVEKNNFSSALKYNTKDLMKHLPAEILSQIADIRVFALNVASHDVKKNVSEYCKNNMQIVDKTIKDYNLYFTKYLKTNKNPFARKFSFHDSKVVSARSKGNDFIFILTLDDFLKQTCKIIFKNYKIKYNDSSLANSWWLYEEIYNIEGGYEIHVLFEKNSKLKELTLTAEDVIINFG
ncbi:MAG: DUF4085 family protein [Eubacteriaceae bacterium]